MNSIDVRKKQGREVQQSGGGGKRGGSLGSVLGGIVVVAKSPSPPGPNHLPTPLHTEVLL